MRPTNRRNARKGRGCDDTVADTADAIDGSEDEMAASVRQGAVHRPRFVAGGGA